MEKRAGLVVVRRRGGQVELWLKTTTSEGECPLPSEAIPTRAASRGTASAIMRARWGDGVELLGSPVEHRVAPGPVWLFYPARCTSLFKEREGFAWFSLPEARSRVIAHPLWAGVEACVRSCRLPAHLLVDADGCPRRCLRIAEELGKRHHWPVVTVASFNHRIERHGGGEHVQVGDEAEAADIALANRIFPPDILITPDYGLAALALGKGARAVSPHGRVFCPDTIDFLLAERHLKANFRRQGGRTKGPAARRTRDDERFRQALERLITSSHP